MDKPPCRPFMLSLHSEDVHEIAAGGSRYVRSESATLCETLTRYVCRPPTPAKYTGDLSSMPGLTQKVTFMSDHLDNGGI